MNFCISFTFIQGSLRSRSLIIGFGLPEKYKLLDPILLQKLEQTFIIILTLKINK